MGKWKRISKSLEDSFAATAFAEAGEFETARLIGGTPKGWVVLAGQGKNLSQRICSYVKQLCQSTSSALHIVWRGKLSDRELAQMGKVLEDLPYEVDLISEDLEKELPRHLRKLRRVVMVVLTGEKRRFRTFFSKISSEFACPLVIISEKDLKG